MGVQPQNNAAQKKRGKGRELIENEGSGSSGQGEPTESRGWWEIERSVIPDKFFG